MKWAKRNERLASRKDRVCWLDSSGWHRQGTARQPVTLPLCDANLPLIDEEFNIQVIPGVSNTNFCLETPCLYSSLQNRLKAANKRMKFCSNWFLQFKNPVCWTWFFKNQVQMDRANVWSLNCHQTKFSLKPPLCSASFMFSHFSAKIDKSNQDKEGQEAVCIEGHGTTLMFHFKKENFNSSSWKVFSSMTIIT